MKRFAMIGTGGFARGHAKRLAAHPDVQVVALCDISAAITQAFAEECFPAGYPAIHHHQSVEALLAAEDLDAVLIASPHTMHFQHAMQALAAGCHCYIEKPMVTSAPDAYALRAEAERSGLTVVIGYNTPCTASFDYLRDTIRSERLGKLELFNGYISQSWLEGTRGKWRQDPALSGGGQAYDSGAHFLCSLVWSIESPVAAVSAFLDTKDTPVDINSVINVRFENGVMAALAVGGNSVHWGSGAAYVFERGVIEIDAWNGSWIREYRERGRTETEISLPVATGHAMHNFIDVLHGRAEPRTTPTDGVLQSELMDAIYESARTGGVARPKRRADEALGVPA
jgi:predicted dehydrogenase